MVINIRANQEMTSDYRCSGRGAVLGEGARLWGRLLTAAPWWGRTNKMGPILRWPETCCCGSCWASRLAAMQRNHQGKTKGQNKGILVHKIPFHVAFWEAAVLVIYGSRWRRALFGTTVFHAWVRVSQEYTLCLPAFCCCPRFVPPSLLC